MVKVEVCRPEATVDPQSHVSGGPELSGVHVVVHQLRVSELLHPLRLETPCRQNVPVNKGQAASWSLLRLWSFGPGSERRVRSEVRGQ